MPRLRSKEFSDPDERREFPLRHLGSCISGVMQVELADGQAIRIEAGSA